MIGSWRFVSSTARPPFQSEAPTRGVVVYVDAENFSKIEARALASNVPVAANDNPYWTRRGAITLKGHDGESIIVVRGNWDDAPP